MNGQIGGYPLSNERVDWWPSSFKWVGRLKGWNGAYMENMCMYMYMYIYAFVYVYVYVHVYVYV